MIGFLSHLIEDDIGRWKLEKKPERIEETKRRRDEARRTEEAERHREEAERIEEDYLEDDYSVGEPVIEQSEDIEIEETRKINVFEQLLMYFGIAIGVFFSSYIDNFKAGESFSLVINWNTIIISMIVSLIIIPFVYNKLQIKSGTPFIVRFGFFVQNGVFWQVILEAIGKTIA